LNVVCRVEWSTCPGASVNKGKDRDMSKAMRHASCRHQGVGAGWRRQGLNGCGMPPPRDDADGRSQAGRETAKPEEEKKAQTDVQLDVAK